MEFLGIGIPEILVILILALIVIGPERLPEMAIHVARVIRELRQFASGFTNEFSSVMEEMQEEFRDVEETASEGARAMTEQLSSTLDEARSGLDLEATAPAPNGAVEAPEAVPASATEESAPVSPAGVVSLEEIRRRVLRGSNGTAAADSQGTDPVQPEANDTPVERQRQDA